MKKFFLMLVTVMVLTASLTMTGQQWQPWQMKPDKASAMFYVALTCGNVTGPSGGSNAPILPCSDSNDGLSWGTAKLTLGAAETALAAASSKGGTIYVACAQFSTASTFTPTVPTALIGCVPSKADNTGGVFTGPTTFTYTGTSSAINSSNNLNLMQGITLIGPGRGGTTTGIDCTGAEATYRHINVSGFGVGFLGDTNCFIVSIADSAIHDNGKELNFSGTCGTESIDFVNDLFSDTATSMTQNALELNCPGGNLFFRGNSFDGTGIQIDQQGIYSFEQNHFENSNNSASTGFYINSLVGNVQLSVIGCLFLQDLSTTPTPEFIQVSGSLASTSSLTLIGDRFSPGPNTMTAIATSVVGNAVALFAADVSTSGLALTTGAGFGSISTTNILNGTVFGGTLVPFSGSVAGSTTSLAANSCGDTVTATVTGATNSMTATASPSADPGTGLSWLAWVSATNTVSVKYCNNTTAAIVPAAATFQVRVIQ